MSPIISDFMYHLRTAFRVLIRLDLLVPCGCETHACQNKVALERNLATSPTHAEHYTVFCDTCAKNIWYSLDCAK